MKINVLAIVAMLFTASLSAEAVNFDLRIQQESTNASGGLYLPMRIMPKTPTDTNSMLVLVGKAADAGTNNYQPFRIPMTGGFAWDGTNGVAVNPDSVGATPKPVVQSSSPVDAATVIITDSKAWTTLDLTPAGSLNTLTVTLPSNGNSEIGQIVRICTSETIATTLTVDGAITIQGYTAQPLLSGGTLTFQKLSSDRWALIQ